MGYEGPILSRYWSSRDFHYLMNLHENSVIHIEMWLINKTATQVDIKCHLFKFRKNKFLLIRFVYSVVYENVNEQALLSL